MTLTPSGFLRSCFLAGVDAVKPERLFPEQLLAPTIGARPTALLAIGKAAAPMAAALDRSLAGLGRVPQTSLIIGAGQPGEHFSGDHPLPGNASRRAADALARWIDGLPEAVDVHVALSGGASSLIAAPRPPLAPHEMEQFFAQLLVAGLEIAEMNLFRKRVTQWSAGRLAAALAPRRVIGWVISDVPGDDPADAGSGPLSPDRTSSSDACARLSSHGLWDQVTPAIRQAFATETLKPGASELARVDIHVIARNADAMAAAGAFANRHGIRVHGSTPPLRGEAADAGAAIAKTLVEAFRRAETSLLLSPDIPELWLYGGETVVALPDHSLPGGRNQELALAAANYLALGGGSSCTTLLSAGTDGRDGTTDVAGAVVDGDTWARVKAADRDPDADLRSHDAHGALVAASATWDPGVTETNVMDLVLALRSRNEVSDLQR
ncbi:MAG: DUF4147 domain-containing protein [Gemmatimonadota bacterium]